jgi:hypothetical protein
MDTTSSAIFSLVFNEIQMFAAKNPCLTPQGPAGTIPHRSKERAIRPKAIATGTGQRKGLAPAASRNGAQRKPRCQRLIFNEKVTKNSTCLHEMVTSCDEIRHFLPTVAWPVVAAQHRKPAGKVGPLNASEQDTHMARANAWADKILGLLKSGNTTAAIAQIKVAPSVKDLKALHTALLVGRLTGRWRDVDAAVEDNLALLSAPRLHRAP